jgi:hypothetical protein
MGRIAIPDRFEYEYEYRDAEYEKTHEECGARSKPQSVGINASGCTK